MTTFLNGKRGIVDLLRQERGKNASKLTAIGLYPKKRIAELQAEIRAYNLLLAWLDDDDVVLLTEADYGRRFPTVPDGQHLTYAPEHPHRYWVSWWSDLAPDAPFKYWDAGHRFTEEATTAYCAIIDADSEEAVWDMVTTLFPDHDRRFISEKASDWTPGDRFA